LFSLIFYIVEIYIVVIFNVEFFLETNKYRKMYINILK